MKRIMVIGGGVQQLPSIRAIRELKWSSVVVDGNPHAVGRREADLFHVADISDKELVLDIARQEKNQEGLDGIYTAGTDFSTTVSYVAEALALPGIPYESALKARDKAKMREVLRGIGLSVPDFRILSAESPAQAEADIRDFLKSHELPLVVKPTMNMGSRGVRRIDSADDIPDALQHAFPHIGDASLLVEELITGPEYSVDALVYRGKVHVVGLADRYISFYPYFIETGHSIPSSISSLNFDKIVLILEEIASGFEVTDGALKGDIFIQEDKVVVGEFAVRLSGGFMSGWTIPISSGVYPVHQALRIAAGLPVEVSRTRSVRALYAAEQAVFSIPGQLKEIEGLDELLQHRACRHVFLTRQAGDMLPLPKNNTDKVLHIIFASNVRDDIPTLKKNMLDRIRVRLGVPSPEAETYLFASEIPRPLLGPELTLPVNREALRDMTPYYGDFSPGAAIPIAPLPAWKEEHSCDWRGESVSEIVGQAVEKEKLSVVNSGFALGSLFWDAILRGGRQALRYIIDTIEEEGERALRRWCDIRQDS